SVSRSSCFMVTNTSASKPRPNASGSTIARYPVMAPERSRIRNRRCVGPIVNPTLDARSVRGSRRSDLSAARIVRSRVSIVHILAPLLAGTRENGTTWHAAMYTPHTRFLSVGSLEWLEFRSRALNQADALFATATDRACWCYG